jgi:hypothetical protein
VWQFENSVLYRIKEISTVAEILDPTGKNVGPQTASPKEKA